MSWLQAAPAFFASIALLLGPGSLIVWTLQLGLAARVATAAVASIVSIGVAGIVFGAFGMSFAPWQILAVAVVAGAPVWVVNRRRIRATGPQERSPWRWLLATWVAAIAVVAVVAFAAVPDPGRVSQTYDNVFHMSAIADILDGGSASSVTLRTLIETDRTASFYPAVWHTLVAAVSMLGGTGPAVAVNAVWLAVVATVWMPGAVWLTQLLLPRVAASTVAFVALPTSAVFPAMPYVLLSWGTLYPTFLATALLPAAVSVLLAATRAVRRAPGMRRWRAAALGALATGGVVAAVALSQPRVLASLALLVAPGAAAITGRALWRLWRGGSRARRRAAWSIMGAVALLALAAAAAFVYLVRALGLLDRPLEERLGGPQAMATQSVAEGIAQAVLQGIPTGVEGIVTWAAPLLGLAVMAGAIVAMRRRGLRSVVVAYAAVIILYALAAGSDDVFAKLATGIWYKDRYRLLSLLPVFGIPLATIGILWATARIRRLRPFRSCVRFTSAAAWATAGVSVVSLVAGGATASVGTTFRLPPSEAGTAVVSAQQIAFLSGLGKTVPGDQRVLGDPWDGAAWSQLYGGREPVFPHVNGQWDAARQKLAWGVDAIGSDPAVCEALDILRVRYVLYDPHALAGGDPSGNHFPAVHRAVEAGLFTEVERSGTTSLWRIDSCGPLD